MRRRRSARRVRLRAAAAGPAAAATFAATSRAARRRRRRTLAARRPCRVRLDVCAWAPAAAEWPLCTPRMPVGRWSAWIARACADTSRLHLQELNRPPITLAPFTVSPLGTRAHVLGTSATAKSQLCVCVRACVRLDAALSGQKLCDTKLLRVVKVSCRSSTRLAPAPALSLSHTHRHTLTLTLTHSVTTSCHTLHSSSAHTLRDCTPFPTRGAASLRPAIKPPAPLTFSIPHLHRLRLLRPLPQLARLADLWPAHRGRSRRQRQGSSHTFSTFPHAATPFPPHTGALFLFPAHARGGGGCERVCRFCRGGR